VKNKRGYFFSLDAFIALLIILGVVLFIKPQSNQINQEVSLQNDFLTVLSSVKIGEINNSYATQLILDGKITNLNNSVLEQIGEFYADSQNESTLLAEAIINDLNLRENVGIYFNGIPIATSGSLDFNDAENVWTSRQIISGIQAGDSVTGYSSRAFLSSKNKVKYFYFGGYVGDGNITVDLGEDVTSANVEAVFSGDFDLYVNDVFINSHSPSANIPYTFSLTSEYFSAGENNLSFKSFSNLYIAGGYIKIVYNESEVLSSDKTYNLPGIDGLINFYDGFYIPGDLSEMEIYLHYNSENNLFLNIGDKEVYLGNSNGSETTVTISDATLSAILDYNEMSNNTIPLRLGISNVSYLSGSGRESDSYSLTDLSGSMNQCALNCSGGDPIKMIDLAINANNAFIKVLLNYSGNRVGLVGYGGYVDEQFYHNLSNNKNSLNQTMGNWTTGGGTCICCGINRAVQGFLNESDPSKFQSMVVMSDGKANTKCPEQGTGSATDDAIQAACDAYENYNLTVYSVGFGPNVDEATLQSMASCANGNYYFSTLEGLADIYEQLANDIINASYFEQTVVAEGIFTKLYPDSYVSVDYTKTIPYGLLIATETGIFGNNISEGIFSIPNDTQPYEVRTISYSGSKWTDNVSIYNSSSGIWKNIFNLSRYNLDYTDLGDPYAVNIPLEDISYGNNTIRVSAGLNPTNSSGGSPYNKIIYSLIITTGVPWD